MSGVNVGTAYVTIIPSARGAAQALQNDLVSAAAPAGSAAGRTAAGGVIGGLKAVGATMGALFAVDKVVSFFGDAISEARESEKVNKLTANAIRATGGAAKVTADQVGDLATAISDKTGVDDEAVQSGANLLLTFKAIRNEAGAGNDVFNQATAAALDLSAAGFGSIESSSKVLGKALNDPIKGISALSRAGVTFTEGQKAQIKAMVQAGDVLGAQKLILKEIQEQVGGAAAASATAGEKLATKWANFKESIGTALLPILDRAMDGVGRLVDWLQSGLGPAIASVVAFVRPAVAAFVSWAQGISGQLLPAVSGASGIFASLGGIVGAAVQLVSAVISRFVQFASALWSAWGQGILSTVRSVFQAAVTAVSGALAVIRGVIDLFGAILRGDWSAAWDAVRAITSGALDAIRGVVQAALSVIGAAISATWSIARAVTGAAWNAIKTLVGGVLSALRGAIAGALAAIGGAVSRGWALARAATIAAWVAIRTAAMAGVQAVVSFVASMPGRIVSALGSLGSLLYNAGSNLLMGMIEGIKAVATRLVDAVLAPVRAAIDAVKSLLRISSPSRLFFEIGALTGEGMALGMESATTRVASAAARVATSAIPSMGAIPAGGGAASAPARGGPVVMNVYGSSGQSAQELATVASQQLGWRVAALR